MIKIAPSLLSCDFMHMYDEIKKIEDAGADILHLDVMDGHFVPNLTFGLPVIEKIRKSTKLPLDVHLMITNPDVFADRYCDLGIDYLSFHLETVFHSHRLLMQIKEKGVKAGVVLNPGTPVQTVEAIAGDIDFILLMSVNPGFGGQSFLPVVYEKLDWLMKLKADKQLTFEIEIDGGVTDANCGKLVQHGADILVAGSYVFRSSDYSQRIRSLKNV